MLGNCKFRTQRKGARKYYRVVGIDVDATTWREAEDVDKVLHYLLEEWERNGLWSI